MIKLALALVLCCGSLAYSIPLYNKEHNDNGFQHIDYLHYKHMLERALMTKEDIANLRPSNNKFVPLYEQPLDFQSLTEKLQSEDNMKYDTENQNEPENYSFPDWTKAGRPRRSTGNKYNLPDLPTQLPKTVLVPSIVTEDEAKKVRFDFLRTNENVETTGFWQHTIGSKNLPTWGLKSKIIL